MTHDGFSRSFKVGARLVTIFSIIALPIWGLVVLGSLFLFDAPGSTESPLTWAVALASWLGPFTTFAAVVYSIQGYNDRSKKTVATSAALLVVGPALLALTILLLEWICHGEFACR